MTQNGKFNPHEHLMQLKSREGTKDYLPVQWRLVWFREACPDGTIETEEVQVDIDREVEEEVYVWNAEKKRSEKTMKRAKGYARFRATVTDGKGGRATGTKSESAASFPDYIEKAETGAIGRALAALGYGTQFVADEFEEAHRLMDAPVDPPTEAGVRELRNYVGRVFAFKDADFEARWTAYKQHVLEKQKADPDLSASDIGKLRNFAEQTERQKAAKAPAASR